MSFLNLSKDGSDQSKSDAYAKQAQNIWSMLDEMAQSDPKSYKEFIEKTLKEGKEMMKPPDSNMCVRGELLKPKKVDLYINFFGWIKVPPPESDQHPIPVYGQPIEIKPKEAITNVAFHPEILDKYGKNARNKDEREMLINLAFEFIESQNSVTIDRDNYEIESFICYGNPKEHTMKFMAKESKDLTKQIDVIKTIDPSQSEIDESLIKNFLNMNTTDEQKTPKKVLIEEVNNTNEPIEVPKYNVNITDKENNQTCIEIKVNLNKINSINECELSIEKDIIQLNANKLFYKPLTIHLNEYKNKYKFDEDCVNAKFVKKNSTLKITINAIKKT